MKQILIFILVTIASTAYSQDKYNDVDFNKLTEVAGTDYVIATVRASFSKNLSSSEGSIQKFSDFFK